jgi:hypothetical protein
MDAWSIIDFIQSGLLWIATGVALLWIFRRIDHAAAVRLLSPVLVLQALAVLIVGYVIGMELFVAHYSGAKFTVNAMDVRLNGPYWWANWLRIAASLAPVSFLIPTLRRSMPVVAGLSLACFTVIFADRLAGMAAGAPP